ncbi:MAG: type II toxin-antitoxin system VapB family antitoxin [Armatimonadota bacterium]
MRTTIDIPTDLMNRAMELSAARTKREVLTTALDEYVKRLLRERLLEMLRNGFPDMTHEDLERMRADD